MISDPIADLAAGKTMISGPIADLAAGGYGRF